MLASLLILLLIFISANGFFRALGAKVDRVLTGITVIAMNSTVSMTFARDIRDTPNVLHSTAARHRSMHVHRTSPYRGVPAKASAKNSRALEYGVAMPRRFSLQGTIYVEATVRVRIMRNF